MAAALISSYGSSVEEICGGFHGRWKDEMKVPHVAQVENKEFSFKAMDRLREAAFYLGALETVYGKKSLFGY